MTNHEALLKQWNILGYLRISFKQAAARIRSLRLTGAFSQQRAFTTASASLSKLKIQ